MMNKRYGLKALLVCNACRYYQIAQSGKMFSLLPHASSTTYSPNGVLLAVQFEASEMNPKQWDVAPPKKFN